MAAAFPAGLALATVTCRPVLATDGTPVPGVTVVLVPEWELIHAATGTRVLTGGASMVTGADGTASTQVVRSDAAGLTRPNVTYQVIWSGPPAAGALPRPFPLYINQPTVYLDQAQPSSGNAGVAVPTAGVPAGGAAGQLLGKKSTTDLDTQWVDPPTGGGGGAVSTVAGRVGNVVLTTADVSGTWPDNQIPGSIARDTEVDAAVAAGIATRVPTTAVGAASGVASLDAGGKIPQAQLPAIALQEFLGAVGSQAAMLALVGQRGDWCTRTDRGTDFQLITEPSSSLGSWRERTYPASPVSSVAGRTGPVVLSADDLTDATTVGTAVVRATDAAAARTAIGAAPAGQLGGHLIRDEGVDLPQRGILDLVGAGATATDDAAGGRTVANVPGVPHVRAPRPRVGEWTMPQTNNNNLATVPNNQFIFGWCPTPPGTYDAARIRITNAGSAGALLRVVICQEVDGELGPLLAQTAALDASATGLVTALLSTPFLVDEPGAGLYIAVGCQGGPSTRPQIPKWDGMQARPWSVRPFQINDFEFQLNWGPRVDNVTGTYPSGPAPTSVRNDFDNQATFKVMLRRSA